MKITTLVAACAVVALAGCAGSAQTTDQQRTIGKVAHVAFDAYGEPQGEKMASLYGALGPAAPDLLGKQGHPVYRIHSAANVELAVASREAFRVGDCVEVRYPASAGSRTQFGLGEAAIAKSAGC